ncbi:MAG: transglycosylase SLT domain-containing protein [Alphaproteobacteria bacterium]|nr:transglycosylase SLT domain-containing protein [Alphaproteobacteria bacterium]
MKRITLLYISIFMVLVGLSLVPNETKASKDDAVASKGNICERYFHYFESKQQIPAKLLNSVSMVESGKFDEATQKMAPWPWTVNVNGKGYYFNSKKEAIQFVNQQRKLGRNSMDLGCMQINLKYHGKEFVSISQMFEPRYNIAYSARMLKNSYKDVNSWKKAVGLYHSATPARSRDYSDRVFAMWKSLKNQKNNIEVAMAR